MNNGSGYVYDLQGRTLYGRPVASGGKPPTGGRSSITSFSVRSGARMRRFLRCCDAEYSIMGTLTYPRVYPHSGRVIKRHFRAWVERCRRYHERQRHGNDWSIFWFLEFQCRGAPHFHFFTNREIPCDLLALWWYDIVDSGDPRHLLAGTGIEYLRAGRFGALSYASKYAATLVAESNKSGDKSVQKIVPDGFEDVGRFWGAVGNVSCHSFFLLVKFDDYWSETRISLDDEIERALKSADGLWKRIDFGDRGDIVRGITMFDEDLRLKIEGILSRYGLLFSVKYPATVLEYPSIDMLPGEVL